MLAVQFPDDREKYTEGKMEFIKACLTEQSWAGGLILLARRIYLKA